MKYVLSKQEVPGVKWAPRANEVVLNSDRNLRGRFINRVLKVPVGDIQPPEDYLKLERALGRAGAKSEVRHTEDLSGVISEIIDRKRVAESTTANDIDSEDDLSPEPSPQPRLF